MLSRDSLHCRVDALVAAVLTCGARSRADAVCVRGAIRSRRIVLRRSRPPPILERRAEPAHLAGGDETTARRPQRRPSARAEGAVARLRHRDLGALHRLSVHARQAWPHAVRVHRRVARPDDPATARVTRSLSPLAIRTTW